MRIGVVGDIHGNYYGLKQAVSEMGSIDMLFFTGDGFRDISRLQAETDVHIIGVIGNCDFYSNYPPEQLLNLDGHKILLTHGHLYGVKTDLNRLGMAARNKGAELVVFGHTHMPLNSAWQEIKLFNPGTLSRERSYRGTSYGIIEISDRGINMVVNKLI